MTTTTTTSGAADLPDAMHMAELLENPINVVCQKTAAAVLRHQHSEFERLHALAAGQATAAQAVAEPVTWMAGGTSTAADGKTELFNLPGYPLMVRAVDFNRIHAESETLRAGYAAARLEIESLKAQLHAAKQINATQADSVLEDAARWREHVGKLDALVAYCPTCCQGFIAKQDMTRDEVLFACGKAVGQSGAKRLREALDLAVDHIDMDALRISHCKDAAVIDAARKQGANHDR